MVKKTTPEQAHQRGEEARALSETKSEALDKNPYSKDSWFFPNNPEAHSAFREGVGDKDLQINDEHDQ